MLFQVAFEGFSPVLCKYIMYTYQVHVGYIINFALLFQKIIYLN